jgi:DNA-binding transcriptional ArsR family regulator
MGVTKSDVFSAEQNQIADFAKALSHPARVAILQYLCEHQTCIGADLTEHLPLAQATVAQHLKELKRIGIIKGEIDPPRVCYCINAAMWEKMRTMIGAIFQSFPDCC